MRHLWLPLLSLTACSDANFSTAQDMGVTQGGAQDIGLARDLIGEGYIPTDGTFTAEGLFSEHDLPISGEGCDALLCPLAAAALHERSDTAEVGMLIQLGFDTSLAPEDFERQPLNLALAVDVSGSMSGEKILATQAALHSLIDQLNEGDQFALISFSDREELLLPMHRMDAGGRSEAHQRIDDLRANGGTNIEAGLQEAYAQVAEGAGEPGIEDRVMLFTDAQPNIQSTDVNSFLGMARFYAEAGIGISVFGVGLDLGAELATEISETRGGNSFYLADAEAISQIFDLEFDYIVTPVAYDLEVEVAAEEGLSFAEAWGVPLDSPGDNRLNFGVTTLFFSARDGGMGVWLTGLPEELGESQALAEFHISYLPAEGDEAVKQDLTVRWEGGEAHSTERTRADDVGVYKMAGLVDEFTALSAGAAFCEASLPAVEAAQQIEAARSNLSAIAAELEDTPLSEEAALMVTLQENLAAGASRCYGGY